MVNLVEGRAFREVRSLPFCYACGKTFGSDKVTRDHIPPACIFAQADRARNPLILPSHSLCNRSYSDDDERAGELLARLHRGPESPRQKLDYLATRDPASGRTVYGVSGINLDRVMFRWVRGFHSSLYREYLPDAPDTWISLSHALPSGTLDANGEARIDPIPQVHSPIAKTIQLNRVVNRVDRIAAYAGKCIYECTWSTLDDGRATCVFALRIYRWEILGKTGVTPIRGCVGLYVPSQGKPPLATRATKLETPFTKLDDLNAFPDGTV